MDVTNISVLLFSFAIGAIIFQLPLGIQSDKFGRRMILMTLLFLGFVSFTTASFFEESVTALTICLFFAGMVVGSIFSLVISYMTDFMPKNLLPTGNLLCGVAFSIDSLAGPYLGGIFIEYSENISYFLLISGMLLTIFIAISAYRPNHVTEIKKEKVSFY